MEWLTGLSNQCAQKERHGLERDHRGSQTNLGSSAISGWGDIRRLKACSLVSLSAFLFIPGRPSLAAAASRCLHSYQGKSSKALVVEVSRWFFEADWARCIPQGRKSPSKARLTVLDGRLRNHNTPSEDAKGEQYAVDK
jgi:hypothetical protein